MKWPRPTQLRMMDQVRTLITPVGANDPRALDYFTLTADELLGLQKHMEPITFPVSQDVPIGYPGEVTYLQTLAVEIAKVLKMLYQDKELRQKALPSFIAELVGDDEAIMSGIGFDFFVGRHLDYPVFIEAAAFGPELVSTAKMAEFFGLRSLNERLSTWFLTLIKPCLGNAGSLFYVTSVGDWDFTREKEHEVLVPYLRTQGIDAAFGPAEDKMAMEAEAIFLRVPIFSPMIWERLQRTKLWERIQKRQVKIIPPLGNNFFSSKYWRPILGSEKEMIRRGINPPTAKIVSRSMPLCFWLDDITLNLLKRVIAPDRPFYFKGIWNFGGYATRGVFETEGIAKALREIGNMPVIVEEKVDFGFLAFDFGRNLPDRRIEVRVRVFDHSEGIKAMPPSARVYLPATSFPFDSLYLGQELFPTKQ